LLLENKYAAIAAVVGFLLALWLTDGSMIAAFGVLALISGIGWAARRLLRWWARHLEPLERTNAAFLSGDQRAHAAGIVAILLGAVLVSFLFPKKDEGVVQSRVTREAGLALPGRMMPP